MSSDSFARLSERGSGTANKIIKVLRLAFILSLCFCFLAADHILIQVWHWPGWLVYIASPMLGAAIWLGLTVGSLLTLLGLADASQKASRP